MHAARKGPGISWHNTARVEPRYLCVGAAKSAEEIAGQSQMSHLRRKYELKSQDDVARAPGRVDGPQRAQIRGNCRELESHRKPKHSLKPTNIAFRTRDCNQARNTCIHRLLSNVLSANKPPTAGLFLESDQASGCSRRRSVCKQRSTAQPAVAADLLAE